MSQDQTVAPYGSWISPISSDLVAESGIGFSNIVAHPSDPNTFVYVELRPSEAGRSVLVECSIEKSQSSSDDQLVMKDLFPDFKTSPIFYSARTRVHEYGGLSHVITSKSDVYFSNFRDQALMKVNLKESSDIVMVSLSENASVRFGDGFVDEVRERLVFVQEEHVTGEKEPRNSVITLSTKSNEEKSITLASGMDFYAAPKVSRDGSKLAYIAWNHPNMQWDNSAIFMVDLDKDSKPIESTRRKISLSEEESCNEPLFSPDGKFLFYITDFPTGYWSLVRYSLESGKTENLMTHIEKTEIGGPLWQLGNSSYVLIGDDRFVCTLSGKVFIVAEGKWTAVESQFTSFKSLALSADKKKVFLIASSPSLPTSICYLDIEEQKIRLVKQSAEITISQDNFSHPELIEFPTSFNRTAFAYFYPPKNEKYIAPENEKPPCIVFIHGGPTSCVMTALSYKTQYWTSRGFGVLHVDYSGSTGYGREYRFRLHKTWGISDVDDSNNSVKYLSDQGRIDSKRLCISGGSAGGFTVFACLCSPPEKQVFSAGAAYYGVSDLQALAHDTHKFESRYLDNLIGKYPEEKEIYIERSPITHVDNLRVPLIIFQGDEDKIVPPNQSEMIYNAVKEKKLPVSYTLFQGEQHGFRKAENIKKSLDGEFYFYSKVFSFPLPSNHPEHGKVTIDNL
ncbi:predicted protein [Naegleria gruberi]|uniref:Predicted protein n=1 Tax=Naegleria gruberi TaxID=5762 RepID=D2VMJ5_NAEGR|nr:uncharacterized protein NAEGRDRAFT_80545 [Naegleria gruberi]EFC42075.1 predicted protein [Naegleria gruberi]|eukprot:XP_002674819.1 predicted protein [Naegleria gruberi strain NEG-M]